MFHKRNFKSKNFEYFTRYQNSCDTFEIDNSERSKSVTMQKNKQLDYCVETPVYAFLSLWYLT